MLKGPLAYEAKVKDITLPMNQCPWAFHTSWQGMGVFKPHISISMPIIYGPGSCNHHVCLMSLRLKIPWNEGLN